MDTALLIARLVLAAVFLVAAIGKLADLQGSRRAVAAFGVPETLAGPIGLLLPLAELVVAVCLIPDATAWGAAIGALVLLAGFIVGISVNLARGEKPDCHCFGQFYSEPIGVSTLIRNVILAAIALFIVVEGHPTGGSSALTWLTQISGTEVIGLGISLALLALLILEAWFLLMLLRQNGRLLVRMETLEGAVTAGGIAVPHQPDEQPQYGPPVGSAAPAFALSGLHGETLTLDALRAYDKPVVLVFSDPNCGPCTALMPDIGRWQRDHASQLTIAQISRGTPDANRAKAAEHGVSHVLLQQDDEVAQAFKSPGTPSAIVVGSDGTIAEPMAVGADAIRALVARLTLSAGRIPLLDRAPAPAPAPNGGNAPSTVFEQGSVKVGDPAPSVELPDVEGKTVRLADFKGNKTMLLFWSLGCGFCQQMLPDLKKWEQDHPNGAPQLVVISSGTADENKAMGLRAPVLLDQNFSTGSSFGANGTPMAVLVDEEGNVASGVAAGAPSVFALAAGSPDASRS
jgi:peroxiredoxin